MKTLKRIAAALQLPRALIHLLLLRTAATRGVIERDIARWLGEKGYAAVEGADWRGFVWLLWRHPAFRNLFYYRIEREGRPVSRVLVELAKWFYRPMNTLFILTPTIGPGLFIQHGFSTIISARSIGADCWINQQVTVGYTNNTDTPTLGDHVTIAAGAKVFGAITIGSNSIIGANAVVFKNVPPNCTVVGVPGYIVRCDGKRVTLPL